MGKSNGKLLLFIILIALTFRLFLAFDTDNFNHPDENFQILEQAHRLVFGYGTIPWDIRYSIRSWIMPGFIAGILYPFKLFGIDDPNIYIPGVRVILAILSLATVLAAYHIGRRLMSVRAGLIAAFLCAIWYNIAYFSIHPLGEVWAGTLFIVAVALALNRTSRWSLIIAGLLAVLTVAVRINYVFGVIVFGVINFRKLDSSGRKYLLAGAAVSFLAVGLIEKLASGAFFASYWHYYEYNRAFFMGDQPIGSSLSIEYFDFLGFSSASLNWIILFAGVLCWKQCKCLTIYVLTILLSHIILPAQKHLIDYRHIYIVLPLLMTTGGIIADRYIPRIQSKLSFRPVTVVGAVVVFLISMGGAFGILPGQSLMYKNKVFDISQQTIFYKEPSLEAYKYLYEEDSVVGVYDASELWFKTGGYFYLHKDIPLYYVNKPALSPYYFSHVLTRGYRNDMPGFRLEKVFGEIYIYARDNKAFPYKADPDYTYDIQQSGVDDRFHL